MSFSPKQSYVEFPIRVSAHRMRNNDFHHILMTLEENHKLVVDTGKMTQQ